MIDIYGLILKFFIDKNRFEIEILVFVVVVIKTKNKKIYG